MNDSAGEDRITSHGHSLLDVLQPATPPAPKNARVIRLFDLEAAKYDPKPEGEPAAAAAPADDAPAVDPNAVRRDTRARDAERAQRRLSLRAAAGLF